MSDDDLFYQRAFACPSVPEIREVGSDGLTKAEYFAAAALTGLLSNSKCDVDTPSGLDRCVELASHLGRDLAEAMSDMNGWD